MLTEISCDNFLENGTIRDPIKFHNGLNVVLGNNTGSNSIGKSTFLLIIDFVFGGNSYINKALDVNKNIGDHNIKFSFRFNEENFYFARNTSTNQSISVCKSNYEEERNISIKEYLEFLKEKYAITYKNLSFRNAISLYSRVYQKDNLNEKNPLKNGNGKTSDAILSLLKLFNLYDKIELKKQNSDEKEKALRIYENAVKCDFIPSIKGKKELKNTEKELKILYTQLDNYSDIEALKNQSKDELSLILDAKKILQLLRIKRSKLESKKAKLDANTTLSGVEICEDLTALEKIFPTIDLKPIIEIEEFHKKISGILKEELKEEQNNLNVILSDLNKEIQEKENLLRSFDIPTGISKKMLETFAEKSNRIKELEKEIENHKKSNDLKEDKKTFNTQYQDILKAELLSLQNEISNKIKSLNDFVYSSIKKAPILELKEKSYTFITPDDTGTGTSYKGLILFDLSILGITVLPILIHDSPMFKNIGDDPIEKILELYQQQTGKQIFIALDKADSYSQKTQEILESQSVLKLSADSCELFGKSWGDNS